MPNTILELSHITAGYGLTHILRDVNLNMYQGEKVAIIGRNGAGKTTLMNTIMGLTQLHHGEIRLKGDSINSLPAYKRNAAGLGLVPQTRDIFPSLSVEENLLCAMHENASLDEAYQLFPRLKARRNNGGAKLSGGEQQMLSIARALMTKPEVLLLDEPLEGLAPIICEQLMEVFEELATRGSCTVLLVEQQAEAALNFATRALIMSNGAVVHDAPSEELKDNPELLHRHIGVGLAN